MTIRKNISNILVGIAIFLLILVLFRTKDEVSNPVIVSPITTERVLSNGQVSQVKVSTPNTKTPPEAGFSKKYINDTIKKAINEDISNANDPFTEAMNALDQAYSLVAKARNLFSERARNSNDEVSKMLKYFDTTIQKINSEIQNIIYYGESDYPDDENFNY